MFYGHDFGYSKAVLTCEAVGHIEHSLGSPAAQKDSHYALLVANLSHPVEVIHHGQQNQWMHYHFVYAHLLRRHVCAFSGFSVRGLTMTSAPIDRYRTDLFSTGLASCDSCFSLNYLQFAAKNSGQNDKQKRFTVWPTPRFLNLFQGKQKHAFLKMINWSHSDSEYSILNITYSLFSYTYILEQ